MALVGLTLVVFALPYCLPSPLLSLYESWPLTPQQRLRLTHDYGFDRPLPLQYAIWMQRLLTGAWGTSRYAPRLVFQESWQATGHTLLLLVWVGLLWGGGVLLWRLRPYRTTSQPRPRWAATLGYVLGAVPIFLVAAILREVLSNQLGWAGLARLPLFEPYYFFHPAYMLLPATLLALSACRLWGLSASPGGSAQPSPPQGFWQQERTAVWLHLEIFFLELYLTEYVFSLPGLGKLGIEAIKRRDIPLLQGFVLCTGLLYLLLGWLGERWRMPQMLRRPQGQVAATLQTPALTTTDGYTAFWPLLLLAGVTLSAPWLFWYDPLEIHSRDQFLAPGYRYLCGTDFLGRDLLSRALGGFRSSLPRAVVLAGILTIGYWLVIRATPGLLRRGLQYLWSTSRLFLQAVPHIALLFMSFLVLEGRPWALEISLLLACLPSSASPRAVEHAPLFQRLCQCAWLSERLLMLEITLHFLNLSAESFAPTWGSDLRHGLHYGHTTVWMLVTPTLAVTWSRYTLARFGDASQRSAPHPQT
ncbi:MAG: hypothetical protein AB7N91_25710 [Candidatus Tectimicrobiota bacterium]